MQNPKDTILFDEALDHKIRQEREEIGADGALLKSASGSIAQANFLEKILVTTLAKISNFIPEGGIWMNTQRPEWNDANNALVGNGVSMVTLYYLRRFMHFFKGVFSKTEQSDIAISTEVATFFEAVLSTLHAHQNALQGGIDDSSRKEILMPWVRQEVRTEPEFMTTLSQGRKIGFQSLI